MAHQPAGRASRAAAHCAALLIGVAAGCAPASTGTAAPTTAPVTGAPSVAASPTPVATVLPSSVPRPSGTLAWPSTFQVEMDGGRYFTSPPFVIPFSIEITEPGWYSGHLVPVFIDLQRWDGVPLDAWPTRIFGFGWPSNVRGPDGPVTVANLTPEAAFDLLDERLNLEVTNRAAVELFGIEGERADIHSDTNTNPVFGSEDGDFGLGPQLDVRLAAVPLQDGLLMILMQAAPADLDAAWADALAILATVEGLGGLAGPSRVSRSRRGPRSHGGRRSRVLVGRPTPG